MDNGWIKLHRKIVNWRFFKNSEIYHLFTTLILLANHKDGFTKDGTLVKKGQLMASRRTLSLETGLEESKVNRILKKLKSEQEIELLPSSKNTIITIVNYDEYQSGEQGSEQQVNSERTASEQQVNTNKNANNNKNKKNTNNIINCEFERSLEEIPVSNEASNILTLLNTVCSTAYRPVKSNTRFINARLNEGYKLEDFRAVIEYKFATWGNDSKMRPYLRPSTLFGTKFDSYLQESKNPFTAKFGPQQKPSSTYSVVTPEELARAKELGII